MPSPAALAVRRKPATGPDTKNCGGAGGMVAGQEFAAASASHGRGNGSTPNRQHQFAIVDDLRPSTVTADQVLAVEAKSCSISASHSARTPSGLPVADTRLPIISRISPRTAAPPCSFFGMAARAFYWSSGSAKNCSRGSALNSSRLRPCSCPARIRRNNSKERSSTPGRARPI